MNRQTRTAHARRAQPQAAALRSGCATTLALVAACLSGCNGESLAKGAPGGRPEDTRPALVRAAAAELRPVQREIRTTGYIESEHEAVVVSKIPGKLVELLVDAGHRVVKDQVLCRLDDREAKSALQQLRVQLETRKVDKELAELEVEAAGRRVEQARIEVQKAEAEFRRQTDIDPEFVSPKVLEEAKLAVDTAKEALAVAEFNERKSRLDVTRMQTSIDELSARIEENEVRLEDHEIVAPFDGVVVERNVSRGETISSTTPLFRVVDPDDLVVWLDRPQSELELVRGARIVCFTADAIVGREFTADVDMVSPIVDRQTGHFRIRIRVREDDAKTLVHGMFVRARILTEEERMALMVPKAAVLSEGDVSVVLAVREGKAHRVNLDPGLELDEWVECRNRGDDGLQAGDLVIVSGHEDLRDQAPVEVAK